MAREVMITGPVAGHNFSWSGGDIVEIEDDAAAAWIECGLAVEVPKGRKAAANVQELDSVKTENEAIKARVAELEGHVEALTAPPVA